MAVKRVARSEHEAAAEAERVAALRREAARARLHEAQRLLDAARREAAEPGTGGATPGEPSP